jgi:uracil-DNA glycosylase family 4
LYRLGFANQPTSKSRDDGLELLDCYVAAAARCAPPGNKPTPREFENCRPYLAAETRLLRQTRVVLTLGRMAHEHWLRATQMWKPGRPGFAHGAEARLPDGRTLLASYHPSRQNTNTGKLTRAMWHQIFRRAREIVES